jgi:hypothetical protein
VIKTNGRRTKNSLLDKSRTFKRYGDSVPNEILLNSQNEYPALRIIDIPARAVIIGLIWNEPINESNSPIKLAVRGVAQFAIVKIKKNIQKIGIFVHIPLK